MSPRTVLLVLWKELLDFSRDRRTIISLIVVPIAISPLLLLGTGLYFSRTRRTAEERRYAIAYREQAPLPGLKDALEKAGFQIKLSEQPRSVVESKASEIGVETEASASKTAVKVYADSSQFEMQVARGRIRQALDGLRDQQVKAELQRAGLSDGILTPFKVDSVNIAPPRKMGGSILGMFLGYGIIVLMISSAMYPAIDMTAGEKERRTLEMLLSSSARREEIVLGKLIAVMTAALVASLLALTSYGMTLSIGQRLESGKGFFDRIGELPLDGTTLVLIGLAVIPMAILAAAVTLAAATPARSTKEAMSYLTPIMFVAIILAIAPMLPGLNLGITATLIPVANFSWLLKELLQGDWSWRSFALTMCANLAYGSAAFASVVRRFRNEAVLFRS